MPLFTHDCAECTYCGQAAKYPHNAVDVYVHNDTLIARYGDDGPEYYSVPYSMAEQMPGYADIKRLVDNATKGTTQ